MQKGMIHAALLAVMMLALGSVGCGKKPEGDVKAEAEKVVAAKADHKHGTWWCDEHGIPEEECSLCSPKVEKESKAKGDWCEMHNRALSQCFFCKPEQRAFFAAKYQAKYGKEPPPIPEFDETK